MYCRSQVPFSFVHLHPLGSYSDRLSALYSISFSQIQKLSFTAGIYITDGQVSILMDCALEKPHWLQMNIGRKIDITGVFMLALV